MERQDPSRVAGERFGWWGQRTLGLLAMAFHALTNDLALDKKQD
jgi:hypothetical protein